MQPRYNTVVVLTGCQLGDSGNMSVKAGFIVVAALFRWLWIRDLRSEPTECWANRAVRRAILARTMEVFL